MEYTLNVHQLALKRWFGKVDGDDVLLIAFISSLTSENPAIKSYMKDGFFRLNRTWLRQQLPILSFSEDWISRRMKALEKIGLLDLQHFRNAGGTPLLYGRMSKLYWRDLERAKAHADTHQPPNDDAHRDECPTGTKDIRPSGTRDHSPTDDCPNDQCKINEEANTVPLSAAGPVSPSEEKEPAEPELFPDDDLAYVPVEEILAGKDGAFARDQLRSRGARSQQDDGEELLFPEVVNS